jgi:hypothetical protein
MGFYESCDFTPDQKPADGNFEIIHCWMAHHQGMSLVALSNFLNESSIQKWFHKEPRVIAAELFLHEKVGLSTPLKTDVPHSTEMGRTELQFRNTKSRAPSSQASANSNKPSRDNAQPTTRHSGSGTPPDSPGAGAFSPPGEPLAR